MSLQKATVQRQLRDPYRWTRNVEWTAWPLLCTMAAGFWWWLGALIYSHSTPGPIQLLKAVGEWASSLYTSAFDVIIFVTTILIALASWNRFAESRPEVNKVPKQTLTAIQILLALILLYIAWLAEPVIVTYPDRTSAVVGILLCAWVAMLVGRLVTQDLTAAQELKTAEADYRTRQERLRELGILSLPEVSRQLTLRTLFWFWVAPLLATAIMIFSALLVDGHGRIERMAGAMGLPICIGLCFNLYGWWLKSDRSVSSWFNRAGFGFTRVFGLCFQALGVLSLWEVGAPITSAAAFVVLLLTLIFVRNPASLSSAWFLAQMRDLTTARAMDRALRYKEVARARAGTPSANQLLLPPGIHLN